MKKKITIDNIKNFIEGNAKLIGSKMNLIPQHIIEQVSYRESKCQLCLKAGKCRICGCHVPGKWFNKKSCNNGTIFPDLMNKEDWEKYKEIYNIKI